MEGQILSWIISLITGGIGGNIAGALIKKISLGPIGNTIAGVIGGGFGGQILGSLMGAGASSPGILGSIVGSGIGGAILMAIIGFVRKSMATSS